MSPRRNGDHALVLADSARAVRWEQRVQGSSDPISDRSLILVEEDPEGMRAWHSTDTAIAEVHPETGTRTRDVGAGGGVRTPTEPILSRSPLPVGLHQHTARTSIAPSSEAGITHARSTSSSVPRTGVPVRAGRPRRARDDPSNQQIESQAPRHTRLASESGKVESDSATNIAGVERMRSATLEPLELLVG